MKTTRILNLLVLLTFVSSVVMGQTVSSKSKKLSIDFMVEEPSEIRLIQPVFESTRGFVKVEVPNLQVEGVVTDENGIKGLYVNDAKTEVDHTGYFNTTIYLAAGDNELRIEVVDENDVVIEKVFYIELKEPTPVATNMVVGKYYALIIGVEEYDHPSVSDLDNPVKDAMALYNSLIDNYTFEKENTFLLKNATQDQILDKFDEIEAKVTADDNLLIFYAGHGHWDEENELGYWLPSDAQKGKRRDWLPNSRVTEFMKAVDTKHSLLITDACFGGSIFKTRKAFSDGNFEVNQLYEMTSRKAMTSGTLKEVPDKSVFMKYLLKKLDTNKDKYMPSEHLFYSIKPAVTNNGQNIPQYGVVHGAGDEGGDFIFIKSMQIEME
ncbi:MAG: caspase family protein [Reichenbachiella sp.]